jgi:uncharacterized protein (TIGR03000 family)
MKANWNARALLPLLGGLLALSLPVISPAPPARAQAGQPAAPAEARLTIVVPPDATISFFGSPTKQKGTERQFITPALTPGVKYYYDVTARWMKDGRAVEETRKVSVTAGGRMEVNFLASAARSGEKLTEEDALRLGIDAYVYGYPLVTMEMTRRVMTNVQEPEGSRAPMGQFANLRTYPNASFREVTTPNADTLYSSAWLDVSKEPYILSIPDEGDRYYLVPMLSGWTDVFQVPGKRTTGDKAQKYAITGPNWKGTLPEGVTEYKSPTSMVWILGRTYCTGTPEDYRAVHEIQDKYSLVPLGAYGKEYTPPKGKVDPAIDMKTAVRDQVNKLDAAAFFKMMTALMKDNPPAPADAQIVEKMAKLGVVSGQEFDASKLAPAVATALPAVPRAGIKKIMAQEKKAGEVSNGWMFTTKAGEYGTDYLQRAFITAVGLGANRPQDAVYPMTKVDGTGRPLNGANRYVMHLAKGETPPVRGFWSLTMYDSEMFFVANPLNKYTVSPRDELQTNADGSIDLYIQNESPGKNKESNWLPAPKGDFVLMLRLYWPNDKNPTILNGSWKPPSVKLAVN